MMTRTLATLAVLIVPVSLPLGCGGTVVTNTKPTIVPAVAQQALAGKRVTKESSPKTEVKSSGLAERHVGDYVVFKFTGAFRRGSLTLTERVIAKENSVLVVDFTMTETTDKTTKEESLRVHIDTKVGGRGEVFGVSRIVNGKTEPAEVADWEAMMAKTVLVVDANEETYGTEEISTKIGNKEITADRTVYRVLIGARTATMTITQSDAFAWGDLGGEIVGDDGTVLYRAELVESGHSLPPFVASDDDI